jgi:hypothetical protein
LSDSSSTPPTFANSTTSSRASHWLAGTECDIPRRWADGLRRRGAQGTRYRRRQPACVAQAGPQEGDRSSAQGDRKSLRQHHWTPPRAG